MAVSAQLKLDIFKRDKYKCKQCGTSEELTIDHIVPLSLGGKDIDSNLRTLCAPCNVKKGNYNPSWKERIFAWIFTRKEANILRNEMLGTIASKEGMLEQRLKISIQSNVDRAVNSIKMTDELKKFNIDRTQDYNTLISMIRESRKREERLLEMIYMICDYMESK